MTYYYYNCRQEVCPPASQPKALWSIAYRLVGPVSIRTSELNHHNPSRIPNGTVGVVSPRYSSSQCSPYPSIPVVDLVPAAVSIPVSHKHSLRRSCVFDDGLTEPLQ
jgi:hypothetical protein